MTEKQPAKNRRILISASVNADIGIAVNDWFWCL